MYQPLVQKDDKATTDVTGSLGCDALCVSKDDLLTQRVENLLRGGVRSLSRISSFNLDKSLESRDYGLVIVDSSVCPEAEKELKELRKIELETGATPLFIIQVRETDSPVNDWVDLVLDKTSIRTLNSSEIQTKLFDILNPTKVIIDEDLYEMGIRLIDTKKSEILLLLRKMANLKISKELEIFGHKLKGVAGSYGFLMLSKLGSELEVTARETGNVQVMRKSLRHMLIYLSRVEVIPGES